MPVDPVLAWRTECNAYYRARQKQKKEEEKQKEEEEKQEEEKKEKSVIELLMSV